jgi:two-component system KDP operon response regulator KdpE
MDDQEAADAVALATSMCFPDTRVLNTVSGSDCLNLARQQNPDIFIIDSLLTDQDGFETIKGIRSFLDVPILMLAYSRDESQVVKALEAGADEYMFKPVHQMELVARMRNLLKRNKISPDKS